MKGISIKNGLLPVILAVTVSLFVVVVYFLKKKLTVSPSFSAFYTLKISLINFSIQKMTPSLSL